MVLPPLDSLDARCLSVRGFALSLSLAQQSRLFVFLLCLSCCSCVISRVFVLRSSLVACSAKLLPVAPLKVGPLPLGPLGAQPSPGVGLLFSSQ